MRLTPNKRSTFKQTIHAQTWRLTQQVGLPCLMLSILTACSSSSQGLHQARDNGKYTQVVQQAHLKLSDGRRTPSDAEFRIPALSAQKQSSALALADLRPPQQLLNILPEISVLHMPGGDLKIRSSQQQLDAIWRSLQQPPQSSPYPVSGPVVRQDKNMNTEWHWTQSQEGPAISAVYHIRQSDHPDLSLLIHCASVLVNQQPVSLLQTERLQYTQRFVNRILSHFDQQQANQRQQAAQQHQQSIAVVLENEAQDLPRVIARAPYQQVWGKLQKVLPLLGLTIIEANASEGEVIAEYQEGDAAEPGHTLALPETVHLLVGDLKHRTSLTLFDEEGRSVSKQGLRDFSQSLAAAFK